MPRSCFLDARQNSLQVLFRCTRFLLEVLLPGSFWKLLAEQNLRPSCTPVRRTYRKLVLLQCTKCLLPPVDMATEQLEGWDRIIAVADDGEPHLDVLLDVLNEYYKNTEQHHETQVEYR